MTKQEKNRKNPKSNDPLVKGRRWGYLVVGKDGKTAHTVKFSDYKKKEHALQAAKGAARAQRLEEEKKVDGGITFPTLATVASEPQYRSVLEEADALVDGERQRDYGHPYENCRDIAKGWSVIFSTEVSPSQVAKAMIWLKLCRDNYTPKRDNRVDTAGYAKVWDTVAEIEGAYGRARAKEWDWWESTIGDYEDIEDMEVAI